MPHAIGDALPHLAKVPSHVHSAFDLNAFCRGHYTLIFSYPQDSTPICTSEMVDLIRRQQAFQARGCNAVAISNDSKQSHLSWLADIEQIASAQVWFPVLADEHMLLSNALLLAPKNKRITFRTSYLVDPEGHVCYVQQVPQNTGRDFGEILRVLDSCQVNLTLRAVGTPANWQRGDDVVILPNSGGLSPSQVNRLIPKVAPVSYLQYASISDKPGVAFQNAPPMFKKEKLFL